MYSCSTDSDFCEFCQTKRAEDHEGQKRQPKPQELASPRIRQRSVQHLIYTRQGKVKRSVKKMLIQHVCKTGAGLASRADHVTDLERFYSNLTIFAAERSRAPDIYMSTQRHSTPKMSRSSSSREAEHHAAVSVSFELAVEARTYSAPSFHRCSRRTASSL